MCGSEEERDASDRGDSSAAIVTYRPGLLPSLLLLLLHSSLHALWPLSCGVQTGPCYLLRLELLTVDSTMAAKRCTLLVHSITTLAFNTTDPNCRIFICLLTIMHMSTYYTYTRAMFPLPYLWTAHPPLFKRFWGGVVGGGRRKEFPGI